MLFFLWQLFVTRPRVIKITCLSKMWNRWNVIQNHSESILLLAEDKIVDDKGFFCVSSQSEGEGDKSLPISQPSSVPEINIGLSFEKNILDIFDLDFLCDHSGCDPTAVMAKPPWIFPRCKSTSVSSCVFM